MERGKPGGPPASPCILNPPLRTSPAPSGASSSTTTTAFSAVNGWNPIADYTLESATATLQTTYLRGLDLSGTLQGAGGVGGVLSITKHGTPISSFYPTSDGNGNVSEYLDSTGTAVAHYEYDAFGNVVAANGPATASFKHRFSTKPQDDGSGLLYHGYRSDNPITGRWSSRGPVGELGGVNLYGFIDNNSPSSIDISGLVLFGLYDTWDDYFDDVLENLKAQGKGALEAGKELLDAPQTMADVYNFVKSEDTLELIDSFLNDPCFRAGMRKETGAELDDFLSELQTNEGAGKATGKALAGLLTGGTSVNVIKSFKKLKAAGKLGKLVGDAAKGAPPIKSLTEQAADLVPLNGGRNRVTLRSPGQQMEVDLAGKSHGGVPTPHTKVSPLNPRAPNQAAHNTKN